MRFQCSYCKAILAIDDCQPGEAVACGHCGNAIAVPESRLSTGSVVGDFVIRKELGQGGMGAVFLAHQISLDRPAALKVLHPQYSSDESYIADFVREARAAASINHPNIVQAYAVGSDDGLFYFAMEYVEGSTLKQVLLHGGRIVPERALAIAQDVAEALEFAWSTQQLVHRDIKPDNIILTSTGKTKVADLGLARKLQADSVAQASEELHGTPQYISPEQLLGYPGNNRSDIYSLGATLYHAITGQFPFSGGSPAEIAGKHIVESLLPAGALVPDLPDAVSLLVQNMTAKRPTDRYENTSELLDDIARVRQGEAPMRTVSPRAQIPVDVAAGEDIINAPIAVQAADAVAVADVQEAVMEAVPEAIDDASVVPSAIAEADTDSGPSRKLKIAPKSGAGKKLRLSRDVADKPTVDADGPEEAAVAAEAAEVAAMAVGEESAPEEILIAGEGEAVTAQTEDATDTGGDGEPENGKSSSKGAGLIVLAVVLIGTFAYFGYAFFFGGDTSAPDAPVAGGTTTEESRDALQDDLKEVQSLIAAQAPDQEIVAQLAKLAPKWSTEANFLDVAAPYVEKEMASARKVLYDADVKRWEERAATLAEEARLAREAEEKAALEAEARRKREAEEQKKQEEEEARKAALQKEQDTLRWKAIDLCKAHKYSEANMLFVRMTASRDEEAKSWALAKQECIGLAEMLYKAVYNSKKKMAGVKCTLQNKEWTVAHVGYRYIEVVRTSTRYEKGKAQTETFRERIEFENITPLLMYRLSQTLWELDGLDPDDLRLRFGAYLLSRGELLQQAKRQLADHPDHRVKSMLAELEIISPEVQKRDFAAMLEELQLFVNQGDRKRVAYQLRKMKTLCPDEFAAQEDAVKKLLEQF